MQNFTKLMEENKNITSTSYGSNIELDHSVSSNAQKFPLGLKLTITPEFCEKADAIMARVRAEKDRMIIDNMVSQSAPGKSRSSNFAVSSLTIGSWQKISQREGDLVGKFNYNSKKIVWEILDRDQKSKMEMVFSNIDAIEAIIHDNEPGVLKIELKEPPDFAVEVPPQPRKHTVWQTALDFTQNQALFCKRHVVTCPPGVLKKHYNMLLHGNSDLLELSRKPFPIVDYPLFSLIDAISLSISSQCNSCGRSPLDTSVQPCYACSHGSFEQQPQNAPPLPVSGFNPNDANFDNGVLNWNHIGYSQENTFMSQGQVLSPPNVAASSSKLYAETNHMDPLLKQSLVTTCQDDIGLNVVASSPGLFAETNFMDPFLEQALVTTCQDNIGLNVIASLPELFAETNHMDPLLEQSWVTTCEDNIVLNQTMLVNDMLTDVAQPIMDMPCLRENPFDMGH